jgi:hypothetical protein
VVHLLTKIWPPGAVAFVLLQVQSYLKVLEESNGYYLYRWGDAPVHTMVRRRFCAIARRCLGHKGSLWGRFFFWEHMRVLAQH